MTAERFLRHASASPPNGPDPPGTGCIDPCPELATDETLTLSVSAQRRAVAVRLTNAYAAEFVRFKYESDTLELRRTERRLQLVLERLRARPD